jgi:predicted site-specific integrase-resolvase
MQTDSSDKKVLTPAEFAAEFQKERTWAYRRIWAGEVAVLDMPGGTYQIPASEVDRLLAEAKPITMRRSAVARQRRQPHKTK